MSEQDITPAMAYELNHDYGVAKKVIAEGAIEAFAAHDATVTLIGTVETPQADFYSDVDISVVCPDDKLPEIVDGRHAIYSQIGPVILTWERPRFAPLKGGKHSVVMFDGAPAPVEMDVFLFSKSSMETIYKGFGEKGREFPWQSGEDDKSPEAKLDYLICVSYWALKYVSRGETSRTEWLIQRYEETREYLKGLPPLTNEVMTLPPLQQVEYIVSLLHASVPDPASKDKISKFVHAARLSRVVELLGLAERQEG